MTTKPSILILALLLLCGCNQPHPPDPEYRVVNIDGCQYFVVASYAGYSSLCHKGNCTNHVTLLNLTNIVPLAAERWGIKE